MSNTESKPPNHDPGELVREEALKMARSVQKPGQTKEQTKLVAQGIAQGIELYKKQQGAKARERDKARKRAQRQKQAGSAAEPSNPAGIEAAEGFGGDAPPGVVLPLRVGGVLFAALALLHLARAAAGWEVVVGPWAVPVWVSLAVAVPLAGLAVWFFRQAAAERAPLT